MNMLNRLLTQLPLLGWGIVLCQGVTGHADVPVVATIEVANPSPFARSGELVTVALEDMTVAPADAIAKDLVAMAGQRQLPMQLVDTDGDAIAESVMFQVDLSAGERLRVDMVRDAKRVAAASIPDQAHAELSRKSGGRWVGHKYEGGNFESVNDLEMDGSLADHNEYFRYEGPGWESDKIGFRLYLDHRNAIDIFGKRTSRMVLSGVGLDGYDSYHEPAEWGMDILKVGEALGAGGFGQWDGNKAVRVSHVEGTGFRIIDDGPLSAAFVVNYTGWKTVSGTCDLNAVVRVNAKSHFSTIQLMAPEAPQRLVAGIPIHPEARIYSGETDIPGNGWVWLATWGKQSLDGKHLGMVLFVRRENFAGFARDEDNHLILLQHREDGVAYHVGAVWEEAHPEAATEAGFLEFVADTKARLDRALRIRITSAAHALAVDRRGTDTAAAFWTKRYVDSFIARNGLKMAYGKDKPATWNYTKGLQAYAIHRAGRQLGQEEYADWAEAVIGSFVAQDGTILTYREEDYNVDMINAGKMLLALWRESGEPRYQTAAGHLLEQLRKQPRTSTGAFWHKRRYPSQVWLDGLYMTAPFMAEAAGLFEQPQWLDDVESLFGTVHARMRDPISGLYYHAWDEAREQSWADPESGLSGWFWGRGLGWFAMSLVDTLEFLPQDAALAYELREMLSELAVALEQWQDLESGLWWQVIDQGPRTGNYLEASASSMFVYALARGVNLQYLEKHYADVARRGYDGLVRRCILQHPDGGIQLDHVCEVAGLGFGRDGSYDYYMSEAIVRDDPKGAGPFILAGLEVARLPARTSTTTWADLDAVLQSIKVPRFPDRQFFLHEFTELTEGMDISSVLKTAIERCHSSGGGRVVVPKGAWATGPIRLLSNVELHLEAGSVLQFKTEPEAYLPVVFTRWEGVELFNYSPLVYAFEAENVAITGEGVLDGQASSENWWSWKGREAYGWRAPMPEQTPARNQLFGMAEAGVPVAERIFGRGGYLRPSFIQPYRCRNILIEGITVLRSPMWVIHPVLCDNVTVRGVEVISHGPNNDGCNPESSRHVLIEDCIFDTGDDCVAIKSGRNADGRRIGIASENIVIRGCEMRDGHGGVVLGSEISGGGRNVFVEDCLMDSPALDRAIRIKTNSVRGGVVENILVRNVRIGEVAESILRVNFLYEEGDAGGFTPVVRNIFMENVICENARLPLYLHGYERSPIEGVHLKNCSFGGIREPSVLRNVQGLTFDGVEQSSVPITDQWGSMLP